VRGKESRAKLDETGKQVLREMLEFVKPYLKV